MEKDSAVERLNTLGRRELREIWQETSGTRRPPPLKRLLIRELAWRIQSDAHGGIDAETRRLLRAAARSAQIERPRRGAKRRPRPRRDLPTGVKLVRTWRGQKHEVTVLDDGKRFRYRGETYRSLTKIAEKITSAHWSGPRFFGLDRVRGGS